MDDRKVKIPKFSKDTGIPKDRVYKWKYEGTNPKAEDVQSINDWINGESSTWNNNGTNGDTASVEFKIGKLTGQLEERESRREDAERYYDKLLQTIGSNLNDLSHGQQILYSFVRAALEYQISVANNDDERKERVDQTVVSKELGENMLINLKGDKALSLRK